VHVSLVLGLVRVLVDRDVPTGLWVAVGKMRNGSTR